MGRNLYKARTMGALKVLGTTEKGPRCHRTVLDPPPVLGDRPEARYKRFSTCRGARNVDQFLFH